MKNIIEFKKKYKDYFEIAYYEKPNRNLGDEMISDIKKLLAKQKEEILDRLPNKEKEDTSSATRVSRGRNELLSQTKDIIKES